MAVRPINLLRHLFDDDFKLSLRILLSSALILKSTRPYGSGNWVIWDICKLLCVCSIICIKLTYKYSRVERVFCVCLVLICSTQKP